MEKEVDELEFMELEHKGGQHDTYQNNCYLCYSENRLLKAKQTVMGRPLSDHFRNPYGDNYPLGYVPE